MQYVYSVLIQLVESVTEETGYNLTSLDILGCKDSLLAQVEMYDLFKYWIPRKFWKSGHRAHGSCRIVASAEKLVITQRNAVQIPTIDEAGSTRFDLLIFVIYNGIHLSLRGPNEDFNDVAKLKILNVIEVVLLIRVINEFFIMKGMLRLRKMCEYFKLFPFR